MILLHLVATRELWNATIKGTYYQGNEKEKSDLFWGERTIIQDSKIKITTLKIQLQESRKSFNLLSF